MSFLQVNGITASSASHHSSLRTSLSSSFLDRVRDGRLASTTRQLVTTFVPGFGPFGMVMDCETHSANEVDIILGFEWAAHIRDFLQASGYRLNRTFDAWTFLVDPSHPIGEFAVPLAPASLSYTGVPTTAHGFSSAHVAAHPGIDSGLGASHDAVRVPLASSSPILTLPLINPNIESIAPLSPPPLPRWGLPLVILYPSKTLNVNLNLQALQKLDQLLDRLDLETLSLC
ncbi:hypothetical protein C8F04DRAFT_1268535 [Mycena alexandri]|uniref:Uncharacterized protein n=1 Tax=Mycena alexandri TaxID=1745969 RepID=A0AAD6SH73_9AGAR|nr:hypothetical protein C8F04DRAFT_1268535 [Mycena alexandri]